MDHPPSTTRSPRPGRRALLTSVIALSVLTAPGALVASIGRGTTEMPKNVEAASASRPVTFTRSGLAERPDLGALNVGSRIEGIQGLPPTTTLAPTPPTTVAPAPVAPAPPAAPAPAPAASSADPSDPATWDRLAKCEAGGNWATNTGNGYYGGLQFSASTWRSVGGTGLPHQNTREVQIEMGQRLQARAGWSQWPACTRKLGYR